MQASMGLAQLLLPALLLWAVWHHCECLMAALLCPCAMDGSEPAFQPTSRMAINFMPILAKPAGPNP